MRVLAIDAGMSMGFAALGGGKLPVSGSRSLRGGPREMGKAGRHCDEILRQLILQERPQVIAFAAPFVGMINRKGANGPMRMAVQPDSIRPLMSFLTIIEMVCDELKIRCVELDEPEARRAFLTAVPRKSKDIKIAVQRACFARGWPCMNDHAGDALCVAAFALEVLDPDHSHEMTPLFQEVYPADDDPVRVIARANVSREAKVQPKRRARK